MTTLERGLAAAAGAVAFLAFALTGDGRAATGGPDALGYTWADTEDGCPADEPVFTGAEMRFNSPMGVIGPLALGFEMPWLDRTATEVWISPSGFVAFSDQGAAGASVSPRSAPDAAAPNDMIAALWRPMLAAQVTVEPMVDHFTIEWRWPGMLASEPHWVELYRDGRIRLSWAVGFFNSRDGTIAFEDATGSEGTTYYQNGFLLEPGFPTPSPGMAACFRPSPRLDCSDPVVLDCGSNRLDLPAALPVQAEAWTCRPEAFPGNERVARFDLALPAALEITESVPDAALFRVAGPPGCTELDCSQSDDDRLEMPLLFAGSHWFVADSTLPGGGRDVDWEVTCTDLPVADCGSSLGGATAGVSFESDYDCGVGGLDGPESHALITTATPGHLAVSIAGATPGRWLVIRDDSGACLAMGEGAATVFDAPAGTYVLTVDGEAGIDGGFTLDVDCGVQLDCASASVAACGALLSGDTSGSASAAVDVHSCSGFAAQLVVDGREDVYQLSNPREQLVTARFLSRQPGQEAYLLGTCDEGDCVFSGLEGGCATLPAGDYLLIVDGPAGSEGPYELQLECRRVVTPGVDLALGSVDASELVTDCRQLDVTGANLHVVLENRGGEEAGGPSFVDVFVDEDRDGRRGPADLLLGQAAVLTPVAAGDSLMVSVPLDGALLFREAVVHVQVETPGDVEAGNDVWNTGLDCLASVMPPPLEARVEWEWTSTPLEPNFVEVASTAALANLDADPVPELMVIAQECCGTATGGTLRALSGRDGSELWSVVDPSLRLSPSSGLAVGDLDGDGSPEIVGHSNEDNQRLLCFDAGGTLRWTSEPLTSQAPDEQWGGHPAIADIDGDGVAEVIWGPNVLDADGALFWTPEPGGTFGRADGGPISVVADLDLDGVQEVIAGPTAYRFDAVSGMGEILWQADGIADGFAAVGQLDDDLAPEVLVAEHYRLHLIEGDTGTASWTVELPAGGGASCGGFSGLAGGPPTIADLDGDGLPEILAMAADWLHAFRRDGTPFWSAPVVECSSGVSSATVFDLDGDGEKEVILKDQDALRFLRASDGFELVAIPGTAGTAHEIPIVGDVDGDGEAEVVSVENRLLGGSGVGLVGVRVFESANTPWMPVRSLWNQHAYHVTNVWDDLSSPVPGEVVCAPPSPLAEGTFRVQRPVARPGPLAPNLTMRLLEARRTLVVDCFQELEITMRVGNGGGAPSEATEVAWYVGDPDAGGGLRGLDALPPLEPGAWADVQLILTVGLAAAIELHVVADDDGTRNGSVTECDEDDNTCIVVDSDVGGVGVPGLPADVGPALRATAHGDPQADDITALFDWSLDFGSPRDIGPGVDQEHYHFTRSLLWNGPPVFTVVVGTEPLLTTSYEDSTPRTPPGDLPRVHGYLVFAADACERESVD